MSRLHQEYLPVEGFRLGEAASLLVGQGLLQKALAIKTPGCFETCFDLLQQAGGEFRFLCFFSHGNLRRTIPPTFGGRLFQGLR